MQIILVGIAHVSLQTARVLIVYGLSLAVGGGGFAYGGKRGPVCRCWWGGMVSGWTCCLAWAWAPGICAILYISGLALMPPAPGCVHAMEDMPFSGV